MTEPQPPTSALPSSPGAALHRPDVDWRPHPASPVVAQLQWVWRARGRLAPNLRRAWWGMALVQAVQHAVRLWAWWMCVLFTGLVAAVCTAWLGGVMEVLAGLAGAVAAGTSLGPKVWASERQRLAGCVAWTSHLLDGMALEDVQRLHAPPVPPVPGLLLAAVPACLAATAVLAVPRFMAFECRAKQAEAKGALRAVKFAESAFHQEKGRYAALPELLETGALHSSAVKGTWYLVSISVGGDGFVARAQDGLRPVNARSTEPDVWEVDDRTAKPHQLHDACGW